MATTPDTVEVIFGIPRNTWCDRCMTSAVIELDLWEIATVGDAIQIGVAPATTLRGCTRCDPGLFRQGK